MLFAPRAARRPRAAPLWAAHLHLGIRCALGRCSLPPARIDAIAQPLMHQPPILPGELGKIHRAQQTRESTACGPVLAAYAAACCCDQKERFLGGAPLAAFAACAHEKDADQEEESFLGREFHEIVSVHDMQQSFEHAEK